MGSSDQHQDTLSPHQHTYVNDDKTLGQLTREAFPKLDNYRDLASIHAAPRPTLDELQNTFYEKPSKFDEDDLPVEKGKAIKLGWLKGVLMTCLLNIWGVMLFLRLSWLVGQTGIVQGVLLITLANSVTFITAFSISAVSTNGRIKGGGIYYMISRSLGPECGAAIGLMFTIANSIAVSMYIVGFCESLNDLFEANEWGEIIDGGYNNIRAIGVGTLVVLLILAFVGMEWVTRAQMILLIVLLAAQVDFIIGSFLGPVSNEERAKGFTGYSADTWSSNVGSDYREGYGGDTSQQTFFSVFGVFFPAVTGITAGANLSGDLKNPSAAIPKGTLLSIVLTYLSYITYALMMGGCVLRGATGNTTQYNEGLNYTEGIGLPAPDFLFYDDCPVNSTQSCKYGLLNSAQVMELVSSWGPLIYMGCFAATLSSAIASLVGAPRVLQALAKDKLYPGIHFFAKGYGANNDPVRGYVLVFVISLGCILIADLNAIAPLLSNFFLASYSLINFSVFHGTITKHPGWRPSFKYYNSWVSLLGSLLCIAVMFLLSWVTALITVAISISLYLYVSYRQPEANWGSSTQAQSYNSALKSVQELNTVRDHVKNYRPQLLVLSGSPSSRPPLIDFCNLLVKNTSLLVCAQVVKNCANQRIRAALKYEANDWLEKHKKKGFFTLIEDEKFERGATSIMQTSGLGKLSPNTLMMGYKRDWRSCSPEDLQEYFNVVHSALNMHLAVGILRVKDGLDYSHVVREEGQMTPEQRAEITGENAYIDIVDTTDSETNEEDGGEDESSPAPQAAVPDPQLEKDKAAIEFEKKKKRKISTSTRYRGVGGAPLNRDILAAVTRFRKPQKKGTIDVWWLYDDGGLTLLLPNILRARSQFAGCELRIFSLISHKADFGREQRNMAALLAAFRIDFSAVNVIPDITKKAQESTKKEFEEMIAPFRDDDAENGTGITSTELISQREKTNRHLRIRELVQEQSRDATFVVMTLPVLRKGTVSAPLYMAWLEMISKDMPPFLFVRGNNTSVLTFYS